MNCFNTFLLSLVCASTLSSCLNNQPATPDVGYNQTSSSDSLMADTPSKNQLTEDAKEFYYLITDHFDYRDSISSLIHIIQKRKWQVLSYRVDERKFYLKPITLDTFYWYDDCNGYDMLTIGRASDNKIEKQQSENSKCENLPTEIDYIYLSGINRPSGVLPSHFHEQVSIVPGSPYEFQYGGKKYTLRAEGTLSEYASLPRTADHDVNFMGRIANYVDGYDSYKLYLESDGIVQLLNADSYSSTCLEIYFIGDLDGDGKPDFLFETNTWYESNEVTLFLSSKADEGKLVKNMGPSGNYYSC